MWRDFLFYDGIRPLLNLFMAATVYEGGIDIPREQASAIVGIFCWWCLFNIIARRVGWLIIGWDNVLRFGMALSFLH